MFFEGCSRLTSAMDVLGQLVAAKEHPDCMAMKHYDERTETFSLVCIQNFGAHAFVNSNKMNMNGKKLSHQRCSELLRAPQVHRTFTYTVPRKRDGVTLSEWLVIWPDIITDKLTEIRQKARSCSPQYTETQWSKIENKYFWPNEGRKEEYTPMKAHEILNVWLESMWTCFLEIAKWLNQP